MTRSVSLQLVVLLLAACNGRPDAAEDGGATVQTDYLNESEEAKDERLEWWRDARFGIFAHWGLYTIPAGTYQGERIPGTGAWIMDDLVDPRRRR